MPGVPLVAAVLPEAAAAAAEAGEAVDQLDAHDVFRLLVAELALDPQPQRRAMRDRQVLAVHAIGQDRLRMEGVDEVDAFVILAVAVGRLLVFVGAVEHGIARVGLRGPRVCSSRPSGTPVHLPMALQPSTQSCRVIWVRDGQRLELGERERQRLGDETVDREPPVRKSASMSEA